MSFSLIINFLIGLTVLILPILLGIWFVRWTIRRSLNPEEIRMKWIITIGVSGGILVPVGLMGPTVLGAFLIPIACIPVGIILAILWAPNIGAAFIRPITDAIDGGNLEARPVACYSAAQRQRGNGHPEEAIRTIREEMSRFPGDFQGELMIAAIRAEDLNDLEGATLAIDKILSNPKTTPNHVAAALNTLADWQLRYAGDRDLAAESLQQVVRRLPDTDWSQRAKERIAHLASNEALAERKERTAIVLKEGEKRIGLKKGPLVVELNQPGAAERAKTLLDQLARFPEDTDAREALARIYSDDYDRPEMALQEYETLMALPHQPARRQVQWLNTIADLEVRKRDNVMGAAAALQRIIDLNPNAAAAEVARNRITRLQLEARANKPTAPVHLATYEERIGLKPRKSPDSR